MVKTRSINENNFAVVMLDRKVLHSRCAGIQIMANFGQSFARRRDMGLCVGTVPKISYENQGQE